MGLKVISNISSKSLCNAIMYIVYLIIGTWLKQNSCYTTVATTGAGNVYLYNGPVFTPDLVEFMLFFLFWLLHCLLFFELRLLYKKSYCKIISYRTTAVYWIYMFSSVRGRRGHDRMVVGFTTSYAISAYHHWCCEFESRPGRGVQHYVIKFVSDLRQVGGFLRVLRFPPQIKLTATKYCWKWR